MWRARSEESKSWCACATGKTPHSRSRWSLPDPSAGAQVDRYFRQLERSGTRVRVISNETVTFGSVAGRLCYVEQEVPGGRPVITGRLVLPSGPRTFVVFSIRTSLLPLFSFMRGRRGRRVWGGARQDGYSRCATVTVYSSRHSV